jgi:hypothetical protein
MAEISPVEHTPQWIGAYGHQSAWTCPTAVINRCIELAKAFGGFSDGHKYVNGVLHKMAPSLRAAGWRPTGHARPDISFLFLFLPLAALFWVMCFMKASPNFPAGATDRPSMSWVARPPPPLKVDPPTGR